MAKVVKRTPQVQGGFYMKIINCVRNQFESITESAATTVNFFEPLAKQLKQH